VERETTLRLRGCGVVFVCQWTEAYRGGWRAGQRSKGGEAVADGVLGEFGDAAEVEFFHDALAVPDDGLGGDEEGGGDFAGAFALGDELEDFLFARGELAEGNGGGGAGWKLRELIAVEEELAELLAGDGDLERAADIPLHGGGGGTAVLEKDDGDGLGAREVDEFADEIGGGKIKDDGVEDDDVDADGGGKVEGVRCGHGFGDHVEAEAGGRNGTANLAAPPGVAFNDEEGKAGELVHTADSRKLGGGVAGDAAAGREGASK